jgi:hypothetical protein
MADKVVVPDEMKKAAGRASNGFDPDGYLLYHPLEGALNWLDEKLTRMRKDKGSLWREGYNTAIEDVRRIYLNPETEVPEAIKHFILDHHQHISVDRFNSMVLESYRLGQKSVIK